MRYLTAWCVVGGGVLGVSLSALWSRPAEAQEKPLDVVNGFVSLPLDDEEVVLPVTRVSLDEEAVREAQSWAVWSRPFYRGTVDRESVERLVAAGRADALESRLSLATPAAMASAIAEPTRRILDVARLVQAEAARIRREHCTDPACAMVLAANPAKTDPRWQKVVALRKQLAKRRTGMMLSARVPGLPLATSFIAVRWKQFPAYAALRREQEMACDSRQLAVRRWIARRFSAEGMDAFKK